MFIQICTKQSVMKYVDMLLEAFESQQILQREKDTLRAALAAFIFNVSIAVYQQTPELAIEKVFIFIGNALVSEGNQENILKYLIACGNILSQSNMAYDIAKSVNLKASLEKVKAETPQAQECRDDLLTYLS